MGIVASGAAEVDIHGERTETADHRVGAAAGDGLVPSGGVFRLAAQPTFEDDIGPSRATERRRDFLDDRRFGRVFQPRESAFGDAVEPPRGDRLGVPFTGDHRADPADVPEIIFAQGDPETIRHQIGDRVGRAVVGRGHADRIPIVSEFRLEPTRDHPDRGRRRCPRAIIGRGDLCGVWRSDRRVARFGGGDENPRGVPRPTGVGQGADRFGRRPVVVRREVGHGGRLRVRLDLSVG